MYRGQLSYLIEKERNQESSISTPDKERRAYLGSGRGSFPCSVTGKILRGVRVGVLRKPTMTVGALVVSLRNDSGCVWGGLCLMCGPWGGSVWMWLVNRHGPHGRGKAKERSVKEKRSPWFGFVSQGGPNLKETRKQSPRLGFVAHGDLKHHECVSLRVVLASRLRFRGMVPIAPPAHSEAHFDCHCLPDLFQDHFSLHEATIPRWCWPSVAWDLTHVERTFGGRDLVAGGVFYHALTIFCCGDTRTLRYCRFKITPY